MAELPPEAAAVLERARVAGDAPDIDVGPLEPAPAPAAGNGEAPSSLIADLRAQHQRITRRTYTTIEFPPGLWAGKLAVRYRYLDEKAIGRMLQLVNLADDPAVVLEANTDIMIAGCAEVLGRRDLDEEWGSVVPGERLRFEPRLAELLQLDAKDARGVVHALFGGRIKGAIAIGAHATKYINWLQGEAPGVAETLEGESPATGS
jgi:hypothetical protein